MAQQITADGGSGTNHAAADLDTIVVDVEDVVDMMRRNKRDEDEQRSHVLRVTPPLSGECKASLHVSQDHAHYPPEMDPKPLHLDARTVLGYRDEAMPDSLAAPDVTVERSRFRDYIRDEVPDDADVDEDEEWDEWWDTTCEVWEDEVRAQCQDREIVLGRQLPEAGQTTVGIRFEEEDE